MIINFVKDKNNNVKTLYHGTPNAGFTEFSEEYFGTRTNHDKRDVAFHFTDNPQYANTYANTIEIEMNEKYRIAFGENLNDNLPHSAIIPVYLNINNPLILNKAREINRDSIERAKTEGYDGIIANHGTGLEYVVFKKDQIFFKYLTDLTA